MVSLTYKPLTEEKEMAATEIVSRLRAEGYDDKQIADAMCDGQYLDQAQISQETAEEVYNSIIF